ncbi:GNAT family N-acetyltransferase [Psychrobacter frigidicola]|uniref:GNAT family N-acetyltransferase n=1 Tax=Psychrobacter frigidicola TaxID=45611 RepID=A0A5C7ACA3_9GAMM|nr:GNAT family N-acetyltransferase [Psychrobacter frigidicola]TXD98443.1 GNAT family N-acetyltransferase [Psychrobacter frigidicola]
MNVESLETQRLYLRQWQPSDFATFAAMNADPEIMRYFPKLLSAAVSDVIANKCQQLIKDNGWGFWALSLKSDLKKADNFIGFVGLNATHADLPFAPSVEIGWRLHKDYWGQGYATEAAQASLKFAFEELHLTEVVAFTAVINRPSQKVMLRIGMTNTQDNFYHPMLETNHVLAKHVLYKITQEQWREAMDS